MPKKVEKTKGQEQFSKAVVWTIVVLGSVIASLVGFLSLTGTLR